MNLFNFDAFSQKREIQINFLDTFWEKVSPKPLIPFPKRYHQNLEGIYYGNPYRFWLHLFPKGV